MKHFLDEFKTFALRGNVMDLAVAFIIGAAFGKIVSSLVDNIILPLASVFMGIVNFSSLALMVGKTVVPYGIFLQQVLDFFIIALSVFVMVKLLNKFQRTQDAKPEPVSDEVLLLREIRDALRQPR